MEFRVYAAFGYVTKVVSNGRVNAELHATSHNWLRLRRAVLYRRFAIGRATIITNLRQNEILRYLAILQFFSFAHLNFPVSFRAGKVNYD